MTKKHPLVKWTTKKFFFFTGVAWNIAALVSRRTASVSLWYSNDLQHENQKRCLSLKCCFGFCAFGFKLLSHFSHLIQNVISLPLWIKLTMGHLLLFFLCNLSSFFSLGRRCRCYWYIGIFWLFSKYYTSNIFNTLFDLKQSSELPQKSWHHGHNYRKCLKQP